MNSEHVFYWIVAIISTCDHRQKDPWIYQRTRSVFPVSIKLAQSCVVASADTGGLPVAGLDNRNSLSTQLLPLRLARHVYTSNA